MRAAGLMGQLRIALRAYAAEGHRPDAVLSRASRFLAGLSARSGRRPSPTASTWPTSGSRPACTWRSTRTTGRLEIARAGHPDPAVRLNDGTTIVRHTPGGPPLGVDPDSDYPTTTLALDAGEVLLICTDGLIETGGHDLDSGWRRLIGRPARRSGRRPGGARRRAGGGGARPASHHTAGPLADRREDDVALMLLRRGDAARTPRGSRRAARC